MCCNPKCKIIILEEKSLDFFNNIEKIKDHNKSKNKEENGKIIIEKIISNGKIN
jgi:hypothetical protein